MAALVKNINSKIMIVKEEKYFQGHRQADQFYKYGFNWQPGKTIFNSNKEIYINRK